MSKFIYLDFNATTPVDEGVLDQMLPWMTHQPWNAASAHAGGRLASRAVESSRARVAELLGASPREIVWTSGSTESNNLAIKGVMRQSPPGSRVLVAATEHKAVMETAEALERDGHKVQVLPVRSDGVLDLDSYEEALGPDVALVSIMLANNETGVIQPLREISAAAGAAGALVHTDATQAAGRLPIDVYDLGVDLASLSAHKFYGPKGVGSLFVRRGVDVEPQLHGGGHESGLRSGTTNVPGVVGMGAAADLARTRLIEDASHFRALTEQLVSELSERLDNFEVVSGQASRLPNTVNIRFVGADGEAVIVNAPDVLTSTGSACTSRIPDASHVLQAMGMTQEAAYECLRFSVGRTTTSAEISCATQSVARAVTRVRRLTSEEGSG